MDDAALQRRHGGLRAIVHAEPAQDHVYMALYRALGYAQNRRDLLITSSLNDERQHLVLAGCEVGLRHSRGQVLHHRFRHVTQSGMHATNGIEQHLIRRLMDSVEYEYSRESRESRITLRKTLAGAEPDRVDWAHRGKDVHDR